MPQSYTTTRPEQVPRLHSGLPLQGVTMLLVEDSRFAADGLRLLALRAGGRLRRAETLREARRHLSLYRPDLVLVDLGLPDGPGTELIAEAVAAGIVALGLSGDPGRREAALQAGAAGFLAKPVAGSAAFQTVLLEHLPGRRGCATGGGGTTPPDRLALREDLLFAKAVLDRQPDAAERAYLSGFLTGLARATADPALERAARALPHTQGDAPSHLAGLLSQRLAGLPQPFQHPLI